MTARSLRAEDYLPASFSCRSSSSKKAAGRWSPTRRDEGIWSAGYSHVRSIRTDKYEKNEIGMKG